ncbi:uncharacterized protein J3D65DRAFT_607477 [Phyllosticta citribraziliensis]|uniref:CRAL-TRIO domain-containing protein n=1 Tax=Phyllosticta citribraziliensis TaxID=989973 RepID=A0ABR1L3H4_9PEZI
MSSSFARSTTLKHLTWTRWTSPALRNSTRGTSIPLGRIPIARCLRSQSRTFASSARKETPRTVLQSSSSFTLGLVVVGVTIGGIFYAYRDPTSNSSLESAAAPPAEASNFLAEQYPQVFGMPSEIPPGRPGNLTPEQEAKLRELWAALAKLTGIIDPNAELLTSNGTDSPSAASDNNTESGQGSSGKKEKRSKRLNVFRRKHHEKSSSSGGVDGDSTSSASSAPTADSAATSAGVDLNALSLEDDKHGQGKAFREALADQSPEDLRNAVWSMVKHDNPDALLLRFLRARKWDVQAALVMLVSTMHWRATEMHVDDDIIKIGELGAIEQAKSADADVKKNGEDFLAQLRMGKSFLHGVDKDGRPMCFVRVRLHRQGEQSDPSLERFTVYTIETARMMLRPPVDTATVVFDMTGFSMANMDYTPVKFMIKCFEANYPESLGAVLVHKAPWVFQGIWTIIRGWLDPVVAGKVHFTRNTDELAAFVPRNQIPSELGGDEPYTYSYVEPSPGENARMADTATRDKLQAERDEIAKKYEEATLEWCERAADKEDVKDVVQRRADLAEQLRANYWRLDPYLRARSLYDRLGVLGEQGALDFYPKKKAEEKKPVAAAETSADDVD